MQNNMKQKETKEIGSNTDKVRNFTLFSSNCAYWKKQMSKKWMCL